MAERTYFAYNTPVGKVTIASDGRAITHVLLGIAQAPGIMRPSALTNQAANEMQEYFAGKRRYFDVPLNPDGTAFQKSVWNEMLDIPYGSTKSYGEIARAVGSPKGFRAVGMAANKNPICILIPCHRVVGSNGKLVGYAHGLEVKRFLLSLETKNLLAKE